MINNDIIYMNIKSTRSLYDDVLPIVDRRVGSRFTKVVGKIFLWSVCWGKKRKIWGLPRPDIYDSVIFGVTDNITYRRRTKLRLLSTYGGS
jgi:hypothetical protein